MNSSQLLAQWYWNHPSLGVGFLNDIAVADDETWWTVGRYGNVFRTTDGGASWEQRHLYTDVDLQAICFVGDNLGWIAGGEGKVFYTTDGGEHWDVVYTGYGVQLYDLVFLDDSHGWAAGENGTIFHSEDGGMNWELQDTPGPEHDLYAIFFTGLEKGWACGEYGTILHTEDGGATWGVQASGSWDHNYQGIYFRDENVGWVVGRIDFFSHTSGILKTANGGEDWMITDYIPDCSEMTAIHFTDENHGFAGGWNKTFYRTDNGGGTWYPLMTDTGFYAAAIVNTEEKLIVAGGFGYLVENACDVFISEDMGQTWQTSSEQLVEYAIRVVEAVDSLHVWFVHHSPDLHLFRSLNGGGTWEQLMVDPTYYFRDLSFISPDEGWAIALGYGTTPNPNKMLKTSNGGDTWDTIANLMDGGNIYGLQFVSATHGWLRATSTEIYRTQDGGFTWELCLSGLPYLGSVHFIDEQRGWAPAKGSNQESILLSTVDGGSSWVADTLGYGGIGPVFFLDESHGWFVNTNKTLRTVDGGATWTETIVPGALSLGKLIFTDTLTGWTYDNYYIDETTTVYISKDGGASWQKDHAACKTGYFYDMDFDESGTGWLVGSDAKILKRSSKDLLTDISTPESGTPKKAFLHAFPNPFSSELAIVLPTAAQSQTRISIYDIQGRKVLDQRCSIQRTADGTIMIDTGRLKNGIYIIKASNGKQRLSQKVIKRN